MTKGKVECTEFSVDHPHALTPCSARSVSHVWGGWPEHAWHPLPGLQFQPAVRMQVLVGLCLQSLGPLEPLSKQERSCRPFYAYESDTQSRAYDVMT